MANVEITLAGVECAVCKKDFDAPDPEQAAEDCIEIECPHCGQQLMLDKVVYWSSSGLGNV